MRILNGKFFKDGKEVAVEFGNTEQIKFLEDYRRRREALIEGIELNVSYEDGEMVGELIATVYWTCACGNEIELFRFVSNQDNTQLEGETQYCYCGKEFEIVLSGIDCIAVKIIES